MFQKEGQKAAISLPHEFLGKAQESGCKKGQLPLKAAAGYMMAITLSGLGLKKLELDSWLVG